MTTMRAALTTAPGPAHERRWRKLTVAQCRAVADARRSGVSPAVLASEYGVSRRTIFRAARVATRQSVVVRVGDWHAEYVLTPEGPVRTTDWCAS